MVATTNLHAVVTPAASQNGDRILFLCNRFQRALLKYSSDLPTGERFMCVEYPNRYLFLIKLDLIGGRVSPQLADVVQRQMEGRRVVYREYPRFSVAVFQVAYAINSSDFHVMPAFQGRQVVIYGGTGGGKSTTIKYLLSGRQGIIVVIDPHYQRSTGQWHSRWLIAGAGGAFDEVEEVIDIVHAELTRRIRSVAPQTSHQALHVAIDEMSNLIGDISNETVSQIYEIVRQGRKYNVFMVLTPHSVEVRAMGLEGTGGMRDSFLFVRMPHIRPGEEHKPRVVDVFMGNPMTAAAPNGRYLIPPPTIYQGEPRLIKPTDLATILGVVEADQGVVEAMVNPMVNPVVGIHHAQTMSESPVLPFEQRYAYGTPAALDLAKRLIGLGYGVRKIGEALPYDDHKARLTAAEALAQTAMGEKPTRGSQDETEMVRELCFVWGVPVNRLARLLDGADHENIGRIRVILKAER